MLKVNNIVFNCIHNNSGILSTDDVHQAIESKPRYKFFSASKASNYRK